MIPVSSLNLDFRLALSRTKLDMRDDWFPDTIGFRDMLNPLRFEKEIAVAKYAPQVAEPFDLPKLGFTLRYSLETSFRDRVMYQAIIDTLIPHYDPMLAPVVFSYRFRSAQSRYMFLPFIKKWLTFIRTIRDELGTGSRVLLTTDVQNYFEAINLRLLRKTLEERSNGTPKMLRAINALYSLLSRWSAFQGLGIPQNRDASSFLGNVFLLPVDEAMLAAGYRYYRYMDDIHIICEDVYHARRAIKQLIGELRKLHLNVNSKKTSILSADDEKILDVVPPPNRRLEKIDKHLESGDVRVMKQALPLLHEYTKLLIENEHTSGRDFKACVNRLERIARVRRLQFDFASIADAVARELIPQPWHSDLLVRYLESVPVGDAVVAQLVEILSDPDKNIYDWQSYHLWKALGRIAGRDAELRSLARYQLRLESTPAPSRAGAILYLGAHGADRDRNAIAKRAAEENSRFVMRAILIATQEVSRRTRKKYVDPEIPADVGTWDDVRGDDSRDPVYFAAPEPLAADDLFVDLSSVYTT